MNWTIRNKLLVVMLAISLVPLGIIGMISFWETQKLGTLTTEQTRLVGEGALQSSTTALNGLGEEMIKRIATDVKKQVDIYLSAHPGMTIADLQKDPKFQEIIVQSVGTTGYTTAMDSATLINRFHKNAKNVGTDYHTMETSNPEFYSIIVKGGNNQDSSGYYPWEDADGVMRDKFGYYTCTSVKTADGITLRIGATTYIDEFSAPVKTTEQQINDNINQTTTVIRERTAMVETLILVCFIITALVVFGTGFLFARSISNPIQRITAFAGQVSRGETIRIEPVQSDVIEINDLNQAFGDMQESLSGKAEAASEIARGNLTVDIPVMSERDILGNAMVSMRTSIAEMTKDITDLTSMATEGKLSARADPERYQGEFRKIIVQVNELLDAIVYPINEAIRLSGKFADNSFVSRFDESFAVEGEFARLKDSLDNVGEQISQTVLTIKRHVDDLSSGAMEADASIRAIASGSEEVAENSRIVEKNSKTGERSVADVLRTVEDFSVAVSDISVKAEQVSSLAIETNTLSSKGEELARTAEMGMAGINHSAGDLNRLIQVIRDQMREIGNIVTIITDIADQTNLLALNAAIEAARAGDAGLGFAVVAGEVKELAAQSRVSAENIGEMISVLDKQSENAAQVMDEANRQVKGGIESVSDTLAVFKEIVTSVEDISRKIADVAASSEEQAAAVEEITAIINEILTSIRQTTGQAERSATITAEMSDSVSQVVKVISSVSSVAGELNTEMNRFQVKEDRGDE